MKPKIDWKLLDRYLKGELTLRERHMVDQWLDEAGSEDIRSFFAELRDDPEMRQAQAEFWARLERGDMSTIGSRRRDNSREPDSTVRTVPRRRLGAFKTAAAATVVLVLGGSVIVWQRAQIPTERHADAVLGTIVAPVGRPPVPASLPDDSRVILTPGSTLRYAASFGAGRREVHLEGEAYFVVRHDASRPFIVRAGDLVVEDLGTEFVVRAYPEDQHGRVIVREGRVGIGRDAVAPGQAGRLAANGQAIVEPADTARWFALAQGSLTFPHMPLREALPKLSRWYDVQFRLADASLGEREVFGNLPSQLDEALNVLAFTLGLHLTRQGQVVTVRATSPS